VESLRTSGTLHGFNPGSYKRVRVQVGADYRGMFFCTVLISNLRSTV
jgi:hypothetical protein